MTALQRFWRAGLCGFLFLCVGVGSAYAQVPLSNPSTAGSEPETEAGALPAPPAASPSAPESTEPKEADIEKYKGEWRGSILFTVQEMENLRKFIALYENNQQQGLPAGPENEDDALNALLNQASKEAEKQRNTFFPIFVLSTLVYLNPGDWLIVMNGRRITPQAIPEAIKILDVGPKTVTFEWKPRDMQEIITRWNAVFPESGDNKKPVPEQLVFDRKQGVLQVTLRPGQRFSTEYFTISERGIAPKGALIARKSKKEREKEKATADAAPVVSGAAPAAAAAPASVPALVTPPASTPVVAPAPLRTKPLSLTTEKP